MAFIVIVKVRLDRPYGYWKERFLAHRHARQDLGIEDLFCHAVVGEQAAVYGVRTDHPRRVHDVVYDAAIRPGIEASGFVVGSERVVVCEDA